MRKEKFIRTFTRIIFLLAFCIFSDKVLSAKDIHIEGMILDESGNAVAGATVRMIAGSREFKAVSLNDGHYSLKISGIYSIVSGLIESSTPYPNPFGFAVHIPFIINTQGDIKFSVYSLSGRKIYESFFPQVEAASYNINWDGCDNSRSPAPAGFYLYAITFRGETVAGRLLKVSGGMSTASGTNLEETDKPQSIGYTQKSMRVKVVSEITKNNYYPVRLTDIVLIRDTVIDFNLSGIKSMPFRTVNGHIAKFTEEEYKKMILKGINLGSSPPGTFPGEIAYAISADYYEKWINRIGQAGFNCIRVYTLHPPVFYEKLANYNYRHRNNPVYLFQGIWLTETSDPFDPGEYDLSARTNNFTEDIHEVTDCIHGKSFIPFRAGEAFGNYQTDVSQWTVAYILGREISPREVNTTDRAHPAVTSFTGSEFSISAGSPSEVFAVSMLDEAVRYENNNFKTHRPVSFTSWPTLDPLNHPTEIHTDEDKASIDLAKVSTRTDMAGLFATYHAYPYYPNFISEQPSYQGAPDNDERNSYSGYLKDLKQHYSTIPLLIGEFGVPSSWGSAHWSSSNMEHGGYSEIQQGELNIKMMHNIIDAGCAGGFMFSWMDEWFKPTWIVQYLEALGFNPGSGLIPTRQLWQNITSPEQNFGLIAFDQTSVLPFINYTGVISTGPLSRISATHDNSFFHMVVEMKQDIQSGDTVMVAFDTYSASTGESILPNGKHLHGRAEFVLTFVAGEDKARHYVTEAYDMNGLTPRFDLSDPSVQKYRSTVSNGSPWKLMEWINDAYLETSSHVGLLPAEQSPDFTPGNRSAIAWSGRKIRIRMPWTMLHFYDPTQMHVIDGAFSPDGGWTYVIIPRKSDGISVSVYAKGIVVSTSSRYTWDTWIVVPETAPREKRSLRVVEEGLSLIPDMLD